MYDIKEFPQIYMKERDVGPKPGDRQPAHEGGREGAGTRPSITDAGGGGKSGGGQSGGGQSGGGQSGGGQSDGKK